MNPWTSNEWEKYLPQNRRRGLRFRFEPDIDPEVKRACMSFAKWLRSNFIFPLRVPVYMKAARRVRTRDKDNVCGVFFEPFDYKNEPYIRVSCGDYCELEKTRGKDNALAAILFTIAHELTHYFQWINKVKVTEKGSERQATNYARYIVNKYASTRDHP